ncbi:Uncharacterized conserved protein YkwD, contains CAP (CSP/antigen 5/PR1) domain [Sporobacter termitidis DSM 10068]|uniref:Uncharacterized conserved protein YkwD, contains CAP (CSP/antigen 5/PR1) domain n=1 Tax=Sporobacter termitidis DSM 10068 TaxID=1123282 RepID=A0A1M5YQK2_9FIRM|nr:CAP domain-containing protein [Sporobacter termitidis]SHI14322.1 Uncharacterized conserved protein YkwD, contains CAP (CSP/antigen 5/PR1) domain [Sporobacter termitidis DSM 10068]
MTKKRIFNAVFLLFAFMTISLTAPTTLAGWEPGTAAAPGEVAASAKTDQNWEDPKAFKAEVVRLVNVERTDNGMNTLEETQALADMADIRAEESAVFFSHTRPDGSNCSTIFSEHHMPYRVAGENLSKGFSSPEKLVAAWMNSASHRKNILNEKFADIGIGLYVNEDGKIYCSQLFYTP